MSRAQITARRDGKLRVALIGAGGIAHTISAYAGSACDFEIVAILSRNVDRDAAQWPRDLLVASGSAMLARKPQLVVECASHAAVAEHVAAVMEAGVDVIIASSGSLADPAILERALSVRSGAQLIVPAGALPGIDGLAAAARDSLAQVQLTSTKPPLSWVGTPAAEFVNPATLSQPYVLFQGTARDAARLYPRNANVAATVALAGIGFERTLVQLVADPAATKNSHRLDVRGDFGRFTMDIEGEASAANPRTSRLTACSILRAIESRTSTLEI